MPYFLISVILIALDQWTKYLAVTNLRGQSPMHIIHNQLSFLYVENRGAAFGILQDRRSFFIVITFAVITLMILYFLKNYKVHSLITNLAMMLILAGAVGNLIDRIRLGFVVDFIALKFGGLLNFPVFNIADMAVVIGAVLLAFQMLFSNEFAQW